MSKKETGTRGEAKGMPLTIKGRRVTKDYLIEHGIINDYFSPIEKEDDSISRRAAIDAMCNACSDWCDEGVCKKVSAIQKLSSAQPEIVRCKDCKHYDGRPCGIVDWYNTADDFCSRAERRTDEVD